MINAYFIDTVVRKRFYFDEWNNKRSVNDLSIPCRVEYDMKLVKNDKGQDINSMATVIMEYEQDIQFNDEIMINGQGYQVIHINNNQGFSGVYKEVFL